MHKEFERSRGWGWCHLGITHPRDRHQPHRAHPRPSSCELGTSSNRRNSAGFSSGGRNPLEGALPALWKCPGAAAPAKGRAPGADFHHLSIIFLSIIFRSPPQLLRLQQLHLQLLSDAGSCKSRQESRELLLILTCSRAWQRAPCWERGEVRAN